MSIRVRRRRLLFAIVLALTAWWVAVKAVGSGDSRSPAEPSLPEAGASVEVESASGARFSEGACVSLAPDDGPARGVVFLDPGHGGVDPGVAGRTTSGQVVLEKTVTLAVAKVAATTLRAHGYRVVLSRWTDTTVGIPGRGAVQEGAFTPAGVRHELLARIACANATQARVLISVHMNSFSDPQVGGTTTLYDVDRPFAASNQRLAGIVQGKVVAALRSGGWSVSDRSTLIDTATNSGALTPEGKRYGRPIILGPPSPGWVPTPSQMPGVILEALFLTRPVEADIAVSARGQRAIGEGIAGAVEQFFGR